jgi:Domain of unknown function (DUF6268)
MLFAGRRDRAVKGTSGGGKRVANAGSCLSTSVRLVGVIFLGVFLTDLPLKAQRVPRDLATVSPFSFELDGESSVVGSGAAKRGSKNVGDIFELSSSAGIVASWQIRDSALLRFGVEWQRYSFDPDPGVPIPTIIQGLNLVLGADYQVSPAVLLRIDALPGLYGSFKNISSKDFNVPFEIGASYFWSTDLIFLAGVLVDVNSDTPVFPAIGVHWKISNRWLLEGIAPRPQLQYLLSDKVTLFAGADFRETTFRMDDRFGRSAGVKKLDSAILQYTEIRASAGATWKVTKSLSIDIEGGFVPYRRFYYPRADDFKVLSEDIVPFARIGLSAKF